MYGAGLSIPDGPCDVLFVSCEQATKEDLAKVFEAFGGILNVDVLLDPQTQRPRFVLFFHRLSRPFPDNRAYFLFFISQRLRIRTHGLG